MFYYGLEWQSLDSYFQFKEISAPLTPEANEIRQYATDSGGISTMCWKNDAGNVTCLATGGGTIPTGSGGVAGAVTFWQSATTLGADDTHFHWDDTNDQLLIGINSGSHLGADGGLVIDEDGSSALIGATAHSATATHAGGVNLQKSRGTHAAQTIVASADRISRIVSQGYDGGAYRDAASIDVEVDGTPGASDMPGRLVFNTTPDGSITLTKAMAIHSTGFIGLGSTTFTPGFKLEMRGAVNADVNIVIGEASADTTSPGLNLLKARGTLASPAATALDDPLGNISWGGWTNAEKFNAARIQVNAGSLWTATNSETYMFFQTTPSGSVSRAERFRIGSAGQWGIGGANFGTSGQFNTSGGAAAPPTWSTHDSTGDPHTQYRLEADNHTHQSSGAQAGTLDHGAALTGLTDDDHTQYALLAGRNGGQIFIGGTAAGDDLTLRATSGNGVGSENIFFQVGNNGALQMQLSQANGMAALGINMAPTIAVLAVKNTSDSNEALELLGDGANANAAAAMFTATANGPGFNFTKGRGSFATPTQTQAGDVLFGISAFGIDNGGPPGTERGPTVAIVGRATQNMTTTNFASDVTFYFVEPGGTAQIAGLFLGGGQHVLGDAGRSTKIIATSVIPTNFIDLSAVATKVLKVPTDGGAIGAYAGRIPIHDAAGNLRYIPYYQ